jgi:hypothetical protein
LISSEASAWAITNVWPCSSVPVSSSVLVGSVSPLENNNTL